MPWRSDTRATAPAPAAPRPEPQPTVRVARACRRRWDNPAPNPTIVRKVAEPNTPDAGFRPASSSGSRRAGPAAAREFRARLSILLLQPDELSTSGLQWHLRRPSQESASQRVQLRRK